MKHLHQRDFNITLLTRDVEKTRQAFPGLRAFAANYDSIKQLHKVLDDDIGQQDALIVLINRDQPQAQMNLMDAAIAAGIPHIIPSFFGYDTRDTQFQTLPIWETKIRVEEYITKRSKEGAFTFTGIQTGSFLDWALERKVVVV